MTEVRASMTGTVWKVEVEEGESVEEEDVLVILESMKMEIPIEASRDGVVGEIRVKEGDRVEEGQVLVVLDP
jgi:acetyl-CoA carboxylase biotin carboxyl carrier protein